MEYGVGEELPIAYFWLFTTLNDLEGGTATATLKHLEGNNFVDCPSAKPDYYPNPTTYSGDSEWETQFTYAYDSEPAKEIFKIVIDYSCPDGSGGTYESEEICMYFNDFASPTGQLLLDESSHTLTIDFEISDLIASPENIVLNETDNYSVWFKNGESDWQQLQKSDISHEIIQDNDGVYHLYVRCVLDETVTDTSALQVSLSYPVAYTDADGNKWESNLYYSNW